MGQVFGVSHDCPFVLYLECITVWVINTIIISDISERHVIDQDDYLLRVKAKSFLGVNLS
jgi:hypothetical protein